MTKQDQKRLWDAINSYVATCNGDPSTHIYTTAREVVVVRIEKIIHDIEQNAIDIYLKQ